MGRREPDAGVMITITSVSLWCSDNDKGLDIPCIELQRVEYSFVMIIG